MNTLYITEGHARTRYVLGKWIHKPIVFMGVNPSRATDRQDDATIRKVRGFANKEGFDGWIMTNIYPQRATNPNDLHKRRYTPWHELNLIHLKELINKLEDPVICAAWGNLIESRPYLRYCLKEIITTLSPLQARWVHFHTKTSLGHPRHPSRLAYDVNLNSFDPLAYIDRLSKVKS